MFQFPRFPPCKSRVTAHHGRRVAPFGDLWITGCQPLPRAFRRVAASFLGSKAPRHPPSALHRTCCSTSSLSTNQGSPPSPTRATSFPRSPRHPVRRPAADVFTRFSAVSFLGSVPVPSPDVPGPTLHASPASPSHDGHARVVASFISPARFRFPGSPPDRDPARSARSVMLSRCAIFRWGDLVIVDHWHRSGSPGPSTGGAAGIRTPDLRRARAALSRLSYGPLCWARTRFPFRSGQGSPRRPVSSGRAWTRTRDLGLIRAAL